MQKAIKPTQQSAEQPTENIKLNAATAPPSEAQIVRGTQILSDDTHAMFLFGMNRANALGELPYESYRRYIEDFCAAVLAGIDKPSPLLNSMVKQAALLDQAIAKLCSDGTQAANPETRRSDLQTAANLASEFRRAVGAVLIHCATAIERQNGAKPKSRKKME